MPNLGHIERKIEVGAGQSVIVEDGIQNTAFFDVNIHVIPNDNFTGNVRFFIGDDIAKTVTYNNENGSCVFAPTNPDQPEIFPPNVKTNFYRLTGGNIGSGRNLKLKVEINNTGTKTVVFNVIFNRKYV